MERDAKEVGKLTLFFRTERRLTTRMRGRAADKTSKA